jgi:hypothetical protein
MILLGKSPDSGSNCHIRGGPEGVQPPEGLVLGRFNAISQDGGIANLVGQQQNQSQVELLRLLGIKALMRIEELLVKGIGVLKVQRCFHDDFRI